MCGSGKEYIDESGFLYFVSVHVGLRLEEID